MGRYLRKRRESFLVFAGIRDEGLREGSIFVLFI
jgi:hypothetical protein